MVPLDLFPAVCCRPSPRPRPSRPTCRATSAARRSISARGSFRRSGRSPSRSPADTRRGHRSLLPMAPRAGGEWLASAAGPRLIPGVVRTIAAAAGHRDEPDGRLVPERLVGGGGERPSPNTSLGISVGGSDEILGRRFGYLASGTYSSGVEANLDQRRARAGCREASTIASTGDGSPQRALGWSRQPEHDVRNAQPDLAEQRLQPKRGQRGAARDRLLREPRHQRPDRAAPLRGARGALQPACSPSTSSATEPPGRLESHLLRCVAPGAGSLGVRDLARPGVPTWYNEEGSSRNFAGLDEINLEGAFNYRSSSAGVPAGTRCASAVWLPARTATPSTPGTIKSPIWTPTDPAGRCAPRSSSTVGSPTAADANFEIAPYNAGGNYAATDRLLAGYAMAELSLTPRLRAIGGARVEQSDVDRVYQSVLGESGTATPSYTDVLPSLALNFDLTERQKLRLSAAQTLARPEYREIAPVPFRAGLGEDQRQGNPNLRSHADPELRRALGVVPGAGRGALLGVFAKRFQDPVEERYLARSGTNTLWFENAESAENYGLEAEVMHGPGRPQRRLSHPLSLFANATWMHSRVTRASRATRSARWWDRLRTWSTPASPTPGTGLDERHSLYNVVGERIVNARPVRSAGGRRGAARPPHARPRLPLPGAGWRERQAGSEEPPRFAIRAAAGGGHPGVLPLGRSVSIGLSWRTDPGSSLPRRDRHGGVSYQ
jgi:hypothetical protein